MRNKIKFGLAVAAIATVGTLNVLFAGGPKDILSAFSLVNSEALAMPHDDDKGDYNGDKCDAGGQGSKGCSIGEGHLDADRRCFVDCTGGYYSCCYITESLSAKCRCIRIE